MTSAARTPHLRRSNLALVLDQLRRHGSCSRSQLVAATGLTRSAIAGLVGELESIGLVAEAAPARDGRPGRPSPVVHVEDRVRRCARDRDLRRRDRRGVRRARRVHHRLGPSGATPSGVAVAETVADVAALVDTVDTQLADSSHPRPPSSIGCGVSVPGLVRDVDGVVVAAPNLGWIDVALAESLGSALGTCACPDPCRQRRRPRCPRRIALRCRCGLGRHDLRVR